MHFLSLAMRVFGRLSVVIFLVASRSFFEPSSIFAESADPGIEIPQALNRTFSLGLREFPLERVSEDNTLLRAFYDVDRSKGGRLFSQVNTKKSRAEGVFVVTSKADGSLLATGKMDDGRVKGKVSLFAGEEIIERDYDFSTQAPLESFDSQEVPVLSEDPNVALSAAQTKAVDFFKKEGMNPIQPSPRSLQSSEKSRVTAEDLRRKAEIAFRDFRGRITGRAEAVNVSSDAVITALPAEKEFAGGVVGVISGVGGTVGTLSSENNLGGSIEPAQLLADSASTNTLLIGRMAGVGSTFGGVETYQMPAEGNIPSGVPGQAPSDSGPAIDLRTRQTSIGGN